METFRDLNSEQYRKKKKKRYLFHANNLTLTQSPASQKAFRMPEYIYKNSLTLKCCSITASVFGNFLKINMLYPNC